MYASGNPAPASAAGARGEHRLASLEGGLALAGAYPATKHAVAALSQQLRLELGPEGLHVLLVCPGPIAREGDRLYPLEGLKTCRERPAARRGPRAADRAAVACAGHPPRVCEKRKPELIVPLSARVLFAVAAICPARRLAGAAGDVTGLWT